MFKVNGFSIDIVDINILSYSFSSILILSSQWIPTVGSHVAEARPSLLRVSRLFDHVTWLTESVSSVVLLMICDTRNPSFRKKADKGQYFCFISQCA